MDAESGVVALDPGSPLAALSMTELVDASREITRTHNLAAVDRIDAVFAMLCAATARARAEDRAEAEATATEGRRVRPAHARRDPARLVRSHLATSAALPDWHAGRLVDTAIQLHTRLPALNSAAREGMLGETLLVDLACRLRKIPDHLVAAVEEQVVAALLDKLDGGDAPARSSLGGLIDRALEALDPDEVDRRNEAARQERRVSFRPSDEGMTSMWAHLPADEAEALHTRLRAAAEAADVPGDPRTAAQRLADALTELGARDQSDGSGAAAGSDDEAGAGASRPSRLHITVIAAAAAGLPARVEFVRGAYASFDWLCHQVLAEENGGARFDLVDPTPGAEDTPDGTLKYFIPEALARRVRLRDGTCRFPGCTVPAENCELDHVIPFNHHNPAAGGPTTEWNLAGLCKGHHLEKTFGHWTYRPGPDGELIITTETGHEYRTYPDGMLAHARDTLADIARQHALDRLRDTEPEPPDPVR